jgi:hypothetical protein
VGADLEFVGAPNVWKFAEREAPMAQHLDDIAGTVIFIGGGRHVGSGVRWPRGGWPTIPATSPTG